MAVWLQLIWPEFVYLQKSDGIFMENVHNTFGIAAAGAGGGAEQLLQVQSSWERWVKVWAGDLPSLQGRPQVLSPFLRRETGC